MKVENEIDAADAPAADAAALRRALGADPGEVTRRVLERTRAWVERETPTGDADRVRALADEIAGALSGAGADIERLDAADWGCHLSARLDGAEPDADPILAVGHLDTVHPVGTLAERPFRVDDGRAYGPGIFDMKAPLAVLTAALERLAADGARPRRPLRVLITCDEEKGSPSSRSAIEDHARGAAAALVLEPPLPGGRVKTARKGVSIYDLRINGRAAHAGLDPERGVSAIDELAAQVLRVRELADAEKGTTLNVGVIGGGTATNVIAEEAWARIEARYFSQAEARRIDRAIRSLEARADDAGLTLNGGQNRPPLERSDAVVRLYGTARRLAGELGFALDEGAAGGGSDGSFTAALGVPTLDGLGVRGDGAHAVHEHILVSDLPCRVALVRRLLETV